MFEIKIMSQRQLISAGTKWENQIGYSRAVKVGNLIEISGTTSVDGDQIIGKGNVYEQTKFIFQKIEKVLQQLGCGMKDVVRTRMYVTDISKWEEIGKAHAEFFSKIKPAATMVEIKSLIDPELLIEIEVTAFLTERVN